MNGRRDAPVLVLGSASIHVARFVRGLCAAGRSVVLATHGELPLGPLPGLREQVVLDLRVTSWSAVRRIRALMRQWSPAVIHAHQVNSVAWHAVRAARGSGVPVVLTLWGSDVLMLPSRGPVQRWMVRSALRGASAWTADARVLLDAATRIAGPCAGMRREWIPIGIDAPPPPGAEPRGRRLLSCRLHKPLYRIDVILRAFASLPAKRADWVLEVAANGEQTPALQQLAAELGVADRVEFSGMLNAAALWRAYRRSAVFVSVPETDGTSVSLLEAMAAGCLPVLSNLPANREWVEDGRNGLLVEDLARLGEALERAIEWSESGRWAREGRPLNEALVADKALFERNIEQFMALYDGLGNDPLEAAR
jgi:L-malate glycosyltransferase